MHLILPESFGRQTFFLHDSKGIEVTSSLLRNETFLFISVFSWVKESHQDEELREGVNMYVPVKELSLLEKNSKSLDDDDERENLC